MVNNMSVTIDKYSGFCWGVVRTVEIAEESLEQDETVYVLGHIIHNPKEIQVLQDKALQTISIDDFPRIASEAKEKGILPKVLIRAHGEPPETYKRALELGIEIIDATCPFVTKLQERVRKFYDQGYQIVIFGKSDHAEVLGVRGVCKDQCIVVLTVEEALSFVQLDKKTVLFSQTTMDRPTFVLIKEALQSRIKDLIVDTMEGIATEFHAKDTICGQVSGREDMLRKYASDHDAIVFVAGKASSNGKVLYDVCREVNPNTYFIEDISEIDPSWFKGISTIGITGATSTPQWYMNHVQEHLSNLVSV